MSKCMRDKRIREFVVHVIGTSASHKWWARFRLLLIMVATWCMWGMAIRYTHGNVREWIIVLIVLRCVMCMLSNSRGARMMDTYIISPTRPWIAEFIVGYLEDDWLHQSMRYKSWNGDDDVVPDKRLGTDH